MRLAEISEAKRRLSGTIQTLPQGDYSRSVGISFRLNKKEGIARALKRRVARALLRCQQRPIHQRLKTTLPFEADLLSYGERFAENAAWSFLLKNLPPTSSLRVLIPGCYMGGDDVQFWLRRGVHQLDGIDVYSLDRHWQRIVPILRNTWQIPVSFRQASVESIPFRNRSFDLVVSFAVLEHVRNLQAMVDETARILSPGGYALHSFGPLYYSYGADHCISAYGRGAGYDHLLLDELEYRGRITNRAFFEQATGNADLAFWALQEQFSFATASEYLQHFRRQFKLRYTVAKISPEGLAYRLEFPDLWKRLLAAGLSEADLLTKSLVVVLQKPAEAPSP
jgi:SAM-dependent methyltransferase